jgi:hypothetical protein
MNTTTSTLTILASAKTNERIPIMKTNVFLKIDRMDMHAVHCLRFWLETFKDYPTWILCDRTEEDGSRPRILETCFVDYPQTKFVASDRSLVSYLS